MTKRLWISLITTVVLVFGVLGINLATNNQPILGLDLQGGVSMILAPTESGVTPEELEVSRALVRDELERTGVAEPDVRVQGTNIVIDLPGIDNPEEALESATVSGQVQLRPILTFDACLPAPAPTPIDVGDTETNPDADTGTEVDTGTDSTETDSTETDNTETDSTETDSTETDSTEEGAPAADLLDGVNGGAADDESVTRARRVTSTDEPAPTDDDSGTDTEEPAPTDEAPADGDASVDEAPADGDAPVPTPIDFATTQATAVPGAELLPTLDGSALCAGPAQGSGEVFERQGTSVQNDASAGGIFVLASLRPDGQAIWNNLAAQCFNGLPTCPAQGASGRGQLAIVLDGVIQSAPTVNAPSFDDEVSISGSFSVDEAETLRDVINRGAFPVDFEPEDIRTVSPSTGSDSLRAAVIAGLIGFALVLTLLIFYYRLFAIVIIAGMATWAAAVYSVAALVSDATNYTLSLAGVTGIIVAIGVTVDSYIVFFERMKDEIRNGRTPRNAAPRSFNSTWRTIWTADLVSVIAAAILFALSVGSVRGFALYLGITTLCDLAICYFFTRPSVVLLARSKFMEGRSAFGLEVAR